jgi:hypothetical protein
MRLSRWGLCLALALAPAALPSCSCKGRRGSKDPDRGKAGEPNLRHKGAAHTATIDHVALAADGRSALTRDVGGGVRLWPTLDGSKEPVPLPARGVDHMSVAATRDGKGWTVAMVESSGQGTILAVDKEGKTTELASMPPHDPMYEAHVLAGGDRILTLHRDSSIRMLDRTGRMLGRFERRKFSPRQLRVSADGRRVVGIVVEGQVGTQISGYLYPIAVTSNPQRMFSGGQPDEFRTPFPPDQHNAVLSPDGRYFVFLAPDQIGRQLRLLVHDMTRPGARRSFSTDVPALSTPTVGFAGPGQVLVTSQANEGTAWQINLANGRTVPRSGPPRNAQAVTAQSNVIVAGYGTWLYVQDISGANQRFLGYESFRPASVAFSPKGKWLAWGYDRSEVYIEPFLGPSKAPTRLESDVEDRMRHLFFVDEGHVLGVDSSNAILLVDWTSGTVVAESSVNWPVSNVEYEPETGVLLLDGAHLGKRVLEVSTKDGFSGQYILPDDSRRSGLFSRSVGGGAVLWTAGNDSKLRTYSLAELRRGLTPDEVLAKGDLLPPGNLLAIDRVGNRYVSSSGRLTVARGVQTKTIELASQAVLPSWDGRKMLAMESDQDGVRVTAYDTNTLEEAWTHRMSTFANAAAWTRDGRWVALASDAGGVVLGVADGKPIGYRCGLNFERKGAPPRDAFNQSGLRSVCEP